MASAEFVPFERTTGIFLIEDAYWVRWMCATCWQEIRSTKRGEYELHNAIHDMIEALSHV